MALGEFDLIRQFFCRDSGPDGRGVVLGIGDDCALLQVPEGKQLAVSLDTLVADVHFPATAAPGLIAERALRVNLSDLAAMGAEPLWFTLGLTLPASDTNWLRDFSQGLFRVADEYKIKLVGGDTTRGPLAFSIQVHGAVTPGQALLRSGAKPGDQVFVTGPVGDGAAALAIIQQQLVDVDSAAYNYLLNRYYRPEPQLKAGRLLAGIASAALDISDGLMADLGHICTRSGVGAEIVAERLPLSDAVSRYVDPQQALNWALSGGDDYQLCFTVPEAKVGLVEALARQHRLPLTAIGRIVDGTGVRCLWQGRPLMVAQTGYQHF